MNQLKVENLNVNINEQKIITNLNITVNAGEVHAVIGPNGAGKSSFSLALMGHPRYQVSADVFSINNQTLTDKETYEKAQAGLFLAFQHPVEVPGVINNEFMREALKSVSHQAVNLYQFAIDFEKKIERLKMKSQMAFRGLNEDFSGGEKKRNEILQLITLKPKFAILDEIDSGLDVDGLKVIGEVVNEEVSKGLGVILISHHKKIFEYLKPKYVHVMYEGQIILTTDVSIIDKIDQLGYQVINEILGTNYDFK